MWDPKTTAVKDHITTTIIQPNYINEINEHISARSSWRCVSVTFETLSKIFLGLSTVSSFASGVYISTTLSFIAGTISTISLVSLQFANFSKRESQRSTDELNVLLTKLNIEPVPDDILELPSVRVKHYPVTQNPDAPI
jgi:hypothetical protein